MSVMNDVIPGKTSVGLPINSPEGCLRACADFRNGKGCNTINFCGKAEGCGSGCSQSGLGPFGNLKCTEDGKFPYMVRACAPSLFFLLFFLGGLGLRADVCTARGVGGGGPPRWRHPDTPRVPRYNARARTGTDAADRARGGTHTKRKKEKRELGLADPTTLRDIASAACPRAGRVAARCGDPHPCQ